jgi:hypothetical protein
MVAFLPPLHIRRTKKLAVSAIRLNSGFMPTAEGLLHTCRDGDLPLRDATRTRARDVTPLGNMQNALRELHLASPSTQSRVSMLHAPQAPNHTQQPDHR